jgi:lipoprotein-releasing system permease protein
MVDFPSMLTLLLWLRYLRRRKIVLLSITAVAVSVALLIVVASLFQGFIQAYEQSAVDLIGDVLLSPALDVAEYPDLILRLEAAPEIEAASPTLFTRGLLHLGGGVVRAVDIWGVEPNSLARVTRLKQSLLRQGASAASPTFRVPGQPAGTLGGYVGIGLITEPNSLTDAYDFEAARSRIGARANLTCGAVSTPSTEAGAAAQPPRRRSISFRIADVVHTGNHIFDSESICMPLESLHRELYPGRPQLRVGRIQIKLAPEVHSLRGKQVIQEIWAEFARDAGWSDYVVHQSDIVTARELQRQYMAVISQQMGMLMVIFGVIDVGVITLVFCIFYMIVRLKQKDVAIIKSCGGSFWLVAKVFLGFGTCVGILGVLGGTLLGWFFMRHINAVENWIQRAFGLKLWDSSVYLFEKIPSHMDWAAVGRIALVAVAATTFGALLPACMAAWTRPVKVLRYE